MERVFWVECAQCRGSFYCNYGEMRHSGVKLECPFCKAKFLPDEAKSIDERDEAQNAQPTVERDKEPPR